MRPEVVEVGVADVIRETADSCSIVLDVPAALREQFVYQAGQFLTVEIPWESFSIRRCYSLSNAPDVDTALKVTVKRVPDGRMSNWINDELKPGNRIRVSPPEGRFVLNADAGEADLTLFGAGSGITPIISLMKAALASTARNVKLIYANRNANSIIFKDELSALEEKHSDRLTVMHHLDDEAGFLARDTVRASFTGRESGEFYVCGPEVFMELVEDVLESAGVPTQHMHFERFVSLLDPDRSEEVDEVRQGDFVPESFVIKLSGRKHTVPYRRGETLLAAAKRAGLRPPSSCEDGFCGSCMAQLVQGDLQMRSQKALTDHEVGTGRVLLCQSLPTSSEPLLVDYDATSFKIEGSATERRVPRLVGAGVLLFLVIGVWILRTTA